MFDLATHFSLLLTGLRAAIATIAGRDPARTPFFVFLHSRLGRTIRRFHNLYARWQHGTLPKPRTHAPRPASTSPRRPAQFHLPQGRAWLQRQLPQGSCAARSQLQHFLTTTDLREFLQAAPQAARILRPLCQMLGVNFDKPTGVPLPPLPPKPEPPRSPPPPIEPPHPNPAPPTPSARFSPA